MAENTNSDSNDDWKRPVQKRDASDERFSESGDRRVPRQDPGKKTPPPPPKKRNR